MARFFKSVYRCQEHSDFKQRRPSLALLRHARLTSRCPFTGLDRNPPWFSQTGTNNPCGPTKDPPKFCEATYNLLRASLLLLLWSSFRFRQRGRRFIVRCGRSQFGRSHAVTGPELCALNRSD